MTGMPICYGLYIGNWLVKRSLICWNSHLTSHSIFLLDTVGFGYFFLILRFLCLLPGAQIYFCLQLSMHFSFCNCCTFPFSARLQLLLYCRFYGFP